MSAVLGLEACVDGRADRFRGARLGVLLNQASVDRAFRYAHERIEQRWPGSVRALFSPQHGLFSEQQDNMVESPHGSCAGLPVYSLYAKTRRPTPRMLAGLDALLVDLQDVGTRVYTYAWTLLLCMEECASAGVKVVVLDRPNPLGGTRAEGPLLEPAFASFVGMHAIPMRHGLTLGELARLLVHERGIGVDLEVVPAEGWKREETWHDLGWSWVPTSPNLPRFEGALVYPGQVLLEGTNVSEGRGTTTPFEVFGAPWLDPKALAKELERHELRGCALRPLRFLPTFQKHAGESCGGIFVHVTDPLAFRPYRTTIAVLAAIQALWPTHFAWRPPPYEYETEKMPMDILTGSAATRLRLARDQGPAAVDALCELDAEAWWRRVGPHLLYPNHEGPAVKDRS